jgi:hypothetical protein
LKNSKNLSLKNLKKNCHPERSEGSAVRRQAEKTADSSLPPNAATAAAMREARNGGLASFQTVSDLMADLNAKIDPKHGRNSA